MERPDFDAIEAEITALCGDNLSGFGRCELNYGATWGLAVKRKDGKKTAFLGGVVNWPRMEDDEELPKNWKPIEYDLRDAIPNMVAFLNFIPVQP